MSKLFWRVQTELIYEVCSEISYEWIFKCTWDLVFTAQLPQLKNATWQMYALVALGLAIIYVFPRITTAVPSTLIAIIIVTSIALMSGLQLKTVGDMGSLPKELPFFSIPDVPFTLETLGIILPYAVMLAIIGLLESLLTASVLDDMTHTESNKHKEARGQVLQILSLVSSEVWQDVQ